MRLVLDLVLSVFLLGNLIVALRQAAGVYAVERRIAPALVPLVIGLAFVAGLAWLLHWLTGSPRWLPL